MAAEVFGLWPLGVKAVEDVAFLAGRDAGALVFDGGDDPRVFAPGAQAYGGFWFQAERHGVGN